MWVGWEGALFGTAFASIAVAAGCMAAGRRRHH
jgi:hypothetical protein